MNFLDVIDRPALDALYSLRALKVSYVFIAVTEFGSLMAVGGLTVCISLFLATRRMYAEVAGLLFAVGGSACVTYALKHLIQRPRPGAFYRAYTESGFSFPSGHATDAAALYGFIAFLVIHLAPRKFHRPASIACGALILAVGFSRLYLGVHYLSDVIAGFFVGAIFVYLGIRLTDVARKYVTRQQAAS